MGVLLYVPYCLAEMVDQCQQQWQQRHKPPNNNPLPNHLHHPPTLPFAFSVSTVYFTLNKMGAKSGLKLHFLTLQTLMSAPLSFITSTDIGSLTNRFSQDMRLLDHSLPLSLLVVVNTLFLCVGQAILIATASVYIAISFPALIAVYFIVQRYYLRTSRQLRLLDLEEKAPVHT